MTEPKPALSEYLNPLSERPTVIEEILQQILSLIRQADLRPGDRLPSEKEITTATNASRPSVREALRALKTMGIVETRPGAGSYLKTIESASLIRHEVVSLVLMGESTNEVIAARKVLECEVARLASHRSPEELASLEHILDDMRARAISGKGMYESTWTFHMALAEVAGNRVMAKLVRILYDMVGEVQKRVYWPNIDLQEEFESHEKLYRAVLSGEDQAELEMRAHLDRVAKIVEQNIEGSIGLSGRPLN